MVSWGWVRNDMKYLQGRYELKDISPGDHPRFGWGRYELISRQETIRGSAGGGMN